MRALRYCALAATFLAAPPTAGQEAFEAELAGHALLPAMTFVPAPADAPERFDVSGRFTGPDSTRIDALYALEGSTWIAAEDAPRTTGLYRPFVGQPVQGFSGIRALGDDRFLVLTDNGFGSQANSADAMLMFHEVEIDWETGRVHRRATTFLRDPDAILPFPIAAEHTATRYLTGADLDLESVQPVGDRFWFGEEFGPYLVATDRDGRVVAFHETEVDGRVVRSPDHYAVTTPAVPGEVTFAVRRSRGFEGMAVAPDGTTLYPVFEGPLWDEETGAFETDGDGNAYLRILAFDTAEQAFTGEAYKYRLEDPDHAIGDVNMIDASRALVIERDGGEGDPRLACADAPRPDCFNQPAAFKRVYLVDFARADADDFVEKVGYVDLLNIQDPNGVALHGTIDGVFTFPFVTIENVDVVDGTHIVVANDNNLPFSSGRTIGAADANEFILLAVGDFLAAR
ncbi:MAG: esterase-like activity of phytase family protein [Alphaproteobacteria bacterium]